VVKLEESER